MRSELNGISESELDIIDHTVTGAADIVIAVSGWAEASACPMASLRWNTRMPTASRGVRKQTRIIQTVDENQQMETTQLVGHGSDEACFRHIWSYPSGLRVAQADLVRPLVDRETPEQHISGDRGQRSDTTHPSMTRLCPTTRLILGVLRSTTTSPISSKVAFRPCLFSWTSHCFIAWSGSPRFMKGSTSLVSRKPGDTALTRMSWLRASRAA
jgi:hypothetical protein